MDVRVHHEQLFGENGLPYKPHERIPNSRAALNVAELAREHGVHTEVHQRLMRGFWAEDADIADPDVLVELSGLDAAEVRRVATEHPYQERIQALTNAVFEMGANGVPAFVVDDKMLIPGAQPHSLFEKGLAKLGYESVESTEDSRTAES